jgi:hypothetical protein
VITFSHYQPLRGTKPTRFQCVNDSTRLPSGTVLDCPVTTALRLAKYDHAPPPNDSTRDLTAGFPSTDRAAVNFRSLICRACYVRVARVTCVKPTLGSAAWRKGAHCALHLAQCVPFRHVRCNQECSASASLPGFGRVGTVSPRRRSSDSSASNATSVKEPRACSDRSSSSLFAEYVSLRSEISTCISISPNAKLSGVPKRRAFCSSSCRMRDFSARPSAAPCWAACQE